MKNILLSVILIFLSVYNSFAQNDSLQLHNNVDVQEEIMDENGNDFIDVIMENALNGDADAQFFLGSMLLGENKQESLYWLEKSAAQNNPQACFFVGNIYLSDEGVEKNPKKALEYFKKGAGLGDLNACFTVGSMYLSGEGVEQDPKKAFEYYKKAADLGDPLACVSTGGMYVDGVGVEKDVKEGAEYFKKGADQYFTGNRTVAKSSKNALEYYKIAADLGNTEACGKLVYMYYTGDGVEQDPKKAFEYANKGADFSDPEACYNVGGMYYRGEGVEQDPKKAFEYYKKGADLGHPQACHNVGFMYHTGDGVEQDSKKAFEYFKLAFEKSENLKLKGNFIGMCFDGMGSDDDHRALFNYLKGNSSENNIKGIEIMGYMYIKGMGVKQDVEHGYSLLKSLKVENKEDLFYQIKYRHYLNILSPNSEVKNNFDLKEIFKYFKKLADNGDPSAQLSVGIMYYNADGIEKSIEESCIYYQKSAEKGNRDAIYLLGVSPCK